MRRVAVNEDQIAAMRLPTRPRKSNDSRAVHIDRTVEAEAIPGATLRAIVAREVESHLPAGALAATQAAEESEQAGLEALGMAMGRSGYSPREIADMIEGT